MTKRRGSGNPPQGIYKIVSSAKQTYYPLIPAQEMIRFMLTHSLHKQVTQIPDSIILTREIDFAVMMQAVNLEIERNDCLRLRFCRHHGKVRQFFLSSCRMTEIPILCFDSAEQQERTLCEDAHTQLHYLQGETYRIKFFKTHDERYGIYLNIHHLVMDNAACFVFFNDLLAVYDHLKNGKPMPPALGKYEDRIRKELAMYNDGEIVRREKEAYTRFLLEQGEPTYLGAEGMSSLQKTRKRKRDPELKAAQVYDPIHDKSELIKRSISQQISHKAIAFMQHSNISGELLVQLAIRLHLSFINNRITESSMLVLCPRRRKIAEKNSGGNVTAAIPWRLALSENDTFLQALDKLSRLQVWAFQHMDFPFIDYRNLEYELFHYDKMSTSVSLMYSWFPIESNSMNNWEYEYTAYDMGYYVMPLYICAMKDVRSGCLKMGYIHRTKVTNTEDINTLHENIEKILELGTEHPDITIKEIFDRLDGLYKSEIVTK